MAVRQFILGASLVALAHCSGVVAEPSFRLVADGGSAAGDSGRPDTDSGVEPIGGGTADSGALSDAGSIDAGQEEQDAGSTKGDGGTTGDAGHGVDAGMGFDAGTKVDAGTGIDAGMGLDAGTKVDAGTGIDAGSGSDAGMGFDAGSPDAGPCTPLQGVVTSVEKRTYCVTGDVIIPAGTTLVVPAGTTFIVMGRYHFGRDPSLIDAEPPTIPGSGSLHAIGTAAEPIVFRGATPSTEWYGIVISHSHDTVHLEYVTIRDTYKNDTDVSSRIWRRGGGLGSYVNVKGTIIRHCTFINNRATSVAGAFDLNSHGVWPNEGPIEITDSLFENNECECESYSGTSVDLCGGGAIRVSHVGGDATLVKIRNNVFRNNRARKTGSINAYGGAIGGFDSSIIIGPGNVFTNNLAGTAGGALSCANQPNVGLVIDGIDPSVTFNGNTPDNGCGR